MFVWRPFFLSKPSFHLTNIGSRWKLVTNFLMGNFPELPFVYISPQFSNKNIINCSLQLRALHLGVDTRHPQLSLSGNHRCNLQDSGCSKFRHSCERDFSAESVASPAVSLCRLSFLPMVQSKKMVAFHHRYFLVLVLHRQSHTHQHPRSFVNHNRIEFLPLGRI